MFGSNRIKIDKELMARLRRLAALAGYSSVDEFITHALEKEVAKLEGADSDSDSDAEIKKRLQGLGYIS